MSNWSRPEALQALRWLAATQQLTLFTDVPVTSPDWRGWGSGCSRRVIDVAVPASSTGEVRPFVEDDFVAVLASGTSVHPIIAWSYADRPAFGHLATRQGYLARTWRPSGPVQPIALVAPGQRDTNVAPAFYAAGYSIAPVPGDGPPKRGGGGSAGGRNDPWDAPHRGEDQLLQALWNKRGQQGWWLAEVPVGFTRRPTDASARRLDAVVVPWPHGRHSRGGQDLDEFAEVVAEDVAVELIEAKPVLNTAVLGQLLCGAHMFGESWPGCGMLSLTACVGRGGDEAITWFCSGRGIRIEIL